MRVPKRKDRRSLIQLRCDLLRIEAHWNFRTGVFNGVERIHVSPRFGGGSHSILLVARLNSLLRPDIAERNWIAVIL